MDVLYPRCAGIEVHKKTAVICVITPQAVGGFERTVRTFTTLTAGLLALLDWFVECGCTHVAMESTGED